jgi:hypothetical protein
MQPAKQLRRGLALWPPIASPATPAEERINGILAGLNQKLRQDVQACDANFLQSRADDLASTKGEKGAWERTVRVTMHGPRYLSMVADDVAIVCDNSYPNHYVYPLVFDLQTGSLVGWASLMGRLDSPPDASQCPEVCSNDTIDSPKLDEMSRKATSGECKRVFDSAQDYQVWPDAKRGALVALATGLPHVIQGCAMELSLSANEARGLGFDEGLLEALEEAHREYLVPSNSAKH